MKTICSKCKKDCKTANVNVSCFNYESKKEKNKTKYKDIFDFLDLLVLARKITLMEKGLSKRTKEICNNEVMLISLIIGFLLSDSKDKIKQNKKLKKILKERKDRVCKNN